MNKLFALLVVSALAVPVFAETTSGKIRPHEMSPAKVATHRTVHHLKKTAMKKPAPKMAAPASTAVSSLRDTLDSPWVLPA